MTRFFHNLGQDFSKTNYCTCICIKLIVDCIFFEVTIEKSYKIDVRNPSTYCLEDIVIKDLKYYYYSCWPTVSYKDKGTKSSIGLGTWDLKKRIKSEMSIYKQI